MNDLLGDDLSRFEVHTGWYNLWYTLRKLQSIARIIERFNNDDAYAANSGDPTFDEDTRGSREVSLHSIQGRPPFAPQTTKRRGAGPLKAKEGPDPIIAVTSDRLLW